MLGVSFRYKQSIVYAAAEGLSPNFLRLSASAYRHFKRSFLPRMKKKNLFFPIDIREKINLENNCNHFLREIEDATLHCSEKKEINAVNAKTIGEFFPLRNLMEAQPERELVQFSA